MTRVRTLVRAPASARRLAREGATRTRARLRAHRKGVAGGVVLAVAAGTLTYAATASPGYTTERVTPNDGAVWVTNDRGALYGRLSTPSASLDVAFPPVDTAVQTHQLDVVQSAGTVVARDRSTGRLTPVDVRAGTLVEDRSANVAAGQVVAVGGGTVAALDPATGAVRATWAPPDQPASVDGLSTEAKPLATVPVAPTLPAGGRGAALAVAADGTVHVAGSGDQLLTARPDHGSGRFTVRTKPLGAALQDVQVAGVGDAALVVDTVGGAAVLPGGRQVELPAAAADGVLQTGPVAEDAALLATPTSLLSLDLGSGETRTLFDQGTGPPAAPIEAGSCRYAAWAGSPGVVVRACGDGPAAVVTLQDGGALLTPQLRLNRRSAVLNDAGTGRVWDLDTGQRLDDWASVSPPPAPKQQPDPATPTVQTRSQGKPKAVPDDLGARPGRTSVLHVLDNDANPAGSVLSIREVTAPRPASATASVAPDGQSIQLAMAGGSGDVTFSYTIDDAKGNRSSAPVVVRARAPGQNGEPELREGYRPTVHTVANQGRLSLPVIGDWRDPDSDPVVLAGAKDGDTPVPVSADGRLRYTAPAESGPRKVTYEVSDGTATTEGAQAVEVLPRSSTATAPPDTAPDVGRGQAGTPIVIRPLDNDLPGTDPTSPDAALTLATDVVAPTGASTSTDLKSGEVTFSAAAAGTYLMTYTASFGDAPYARGTIRVDVSEPAARTDRPTAMLDQAVVYGENPTTVDVLANDFDPSGRLLAVQSATPGSGADLEVAVIRGRWLRIQPRSDTLRPNPQRVTYTVTNGVTGTVTGEVAVQQLPLPKERTPEPADDHATVRSGDAVAIPVLDNDTHPAGEPLTLLSQVEGVPSAGMLQVRGPGGAESDAGSAYAGGRVVRYQAPEVTTRTTVSVEYVVEDPEGNRAAGTAYVSVVPAPTADQPNAAPTPAQVEGRIVAGDTMTIQIPTSSVDPDGDSVTLVGLDSAPTQGRVLASTLSSITYQAYPTSAETDEFGYVVADRFGKVATGTIRVAVLPPGDPQPPVAVDDYVTAAPGATVRLEVLENDIVAIGDSATLQPLAPLNPGLGDRARLDPQASLLTVRAPEDLGPLTVRYAARGASGAESVATVHVRTREGTNIPPVVRNPAAEPGPGATSVTVDVLASASDPDGGDAPLKVTRVFSTPGASVSGGRVTVPVGPVPQVVSYEVADDDGGLALGSMYVPSVGSGAPRVRPDSLIRVDTDASTTVSLADVVLDPSGKDVVLTTDDRLSASPAGVLEVEAAGPDAVKVTARKGYAGPAAIAFQVTNGATATDPGGERALLTVPVQVGPETPVLRCPQAEIPVIVGGRSRPVSIPELCHVWTADPGDLDSLQFSGRLPDQQRGLTVANADPRTIVVTASGDAVPGTRAKLLVTVPGTAAAPAEMTVLVSAAGPPRLAPVSVAGVKAGTSRTVDLAGYITSQLGDPRPSVVRVVARPGNPDVKVTQAGPTRLTVSPGPGANGRAVFDVTVTDSADTTRTDRQGTGTLTVDILGAPGAPGRPVATGGTASRQATLSWAAAANNGLPIDYYTLTWSGGQRRCPASPCTVTGLDNGTPYTFTVLAHNGVGDGPPSRPSAAVTPDTVPRAPGNPRTANPADRSIEVAWSPAPVDGTPVTKYLVTWPGGSAQTSGTSVTARGLDNNAVTRFTVKALNKAGWGPGAATTGQSAGRPPRPAAPRITPTQVQGGEQQTVRVSWARVPANGPGPTAYTLVRSGGGGTVVVCEKVTDTSCVAPAVTNDGSTYSFTVTASNAVNDSPAGPASTLLAAGAPGKFSDVAASATGASGEVELSFVSPAAHDDRLSIACRIDGADCGSWDAPTVPTRLTRTITTAANGTQPRITLTATNRSGSSTASVVSDTVHGALGEVSVTGLSAQGPWVAFGVSLDPRGLGGEVTVTVTANGKTVDSFTDKTGGGTYAVNREVKVGHEADVVVTATAKRDGETTKGSASTRTGRGSVEASGRPAGSCEPEAEEPCTDVAVTLAVDNLVFSGEVVCRVAERDAKDDPMWSGTLQTDSRGRATRDVPESEFTATSGTAYRITCDDRGSPAAPVRTDWRAP